MTVEKLSPSGDIIISAMIDGYRVARRYSGYTRREAMAAFRADYRQAKGEGF